ncbi:Hypothetical Protein AKJ09_05792 [Labilithrix luteola]|uniref:receptor protein-tyrosine kinase n=1 Tax=Labilithrix luteola TaxID=1391654 RepID=A0A0K1Q021_9BACT|nr:glycine-rich protein [Labilithrix luteola]AKU99128.1 Hypothetical Protein AKJ09_05792 [Labilithrix luteola]
MRNVLPALSLFVLSTSLLTVACSSTAPQATQQAAPQPAPSEPGAIAASEYRLGGKVVGLKGSGLTLATAAGEELAVSSSGSFTFATKLPKGSAFSVAVKKQPSSPMQACSIAGGSGTVGEGDVTSITVNCTTDTFTLSGKVSGLEGTGFVLTEGTERVAVSGNGTFAMPSTREDGSSYNVVVAHQPTSPSQTCVVGNDHGTIAGANVSNVDVVCSTNSYTLGGSVAGLVGTIVLADDAGDELSIDANGSFSFPTKIASGASFGVQVKTQPKAQQCEVTGGSGTVGAGDVSSVVVNCTTVAFTVGGTVSGLAGSGLVLTDNGEADLSVNASTFAFPSLVLRGAHYSVAVKSQPTNPWQTCTVDPSTATGTMAGAAVTDVAVSCTTNSYALGGTISGLSGSGLVLANSSSTTSPAGGATSFSLGSLASGSSYTVSVTTQPTNPWQTCSVDAPTATGTIGGNDASTHVSCTTNTYAISGTVAKQASDLVLTNGTADVTVHAGETTFSFPTNASGTSYEITVKTQPTNQVCTVTSGSGTLTNSGVSDVSVNCVWAMTFAYTGAPQTFTVPATVTTLSVDVQGAAGGTSGGKSAFGGRVEATMSVTGGQVLNVYVGGTTTTTNAGGYNGGGNGYANGTFVATGGGGASDIRIGGNAIVNRVIVAGGGGGTGQDGPVLIGGVGGGLVGGDAPTAGAANPNDNGKGGTQSAGGAGGTYPGYGNGTPGSLALGGAGANAGRSGGGGGGYYGGGGGVWNGGGGGSSYTNSGFASDVVHTQGYRAGDGQIIIMWDTP